VLVTFAIDYEDRFPWPLANTMTVLSHLDQHPRPLADLPGDHGIAGNGKSLVERHIVAVVTKDPANPGKKLVALTDRGFAVMQHHPGRLAAVDAQWRDSYGDAVSGLRDALEPVAATAPGQLDFVMGPLHRG